MSSLGLLFCASALLQLCVRCGTSPVAARPKSVGATGNDSPFSTLTGLLKGVSKDPTMNSKLSQHMDDFIKAVLPANCHQVQQLKTNFFKSFKSSMDIDPKVMKTMDELITTLLPALCRQQNPNGVTDMDNMVTQASFLSQLNKFGKMLGEKHSSANRSSKGHQQPPPAEYSANAFDVDAGFQKGWGLGNDFESH